MNIVNDYAKNNSVKSLLTRSCVIMVAVILCTNLSTIRQDVVGEVCAYIGMLANALLIFHTIALVVKYRQHAESGDDRSFFSK